MTLAPCPNCSGYREDASEWFFGRPTLVTGRRSGKVFVGGCCAFSTGLSRMYDTEEQAAADWDYHREHAAAGDLRLNAMRVRLDALAIPRVRR